MSQIAGVGRQILPIFTARAEEYVRLLAFCGTGFLISSELFVTCWHCVSETLPPDQSYCVAIEEDEGSFKSWQLHDLAQDGNGSDLATARLRIASSLQPSTQLRLAKEPALLGTNVLSYGYPYTDVTHDSDGNPRFELRARCLKGYISRAAPYERPGFGSVASYEVDMPAPKGLSGSPLIREGSMEVIGVVYGECETATIEEFARVDPNTGEREPEVQRLVSFCLAHYTDTLRNLRGTATEGRTLADFLATIG